MADLEVYVGGLEDYLGMVILGVGVSERRGGLLLIKKKKGDLCYVDLFFVFLFK